MFYLQLVNRESKPFIDYKFSIPFKARHNSMLIQFGEKIESFWVLTVPSISTHLTQQSFHYQKHYWKPGLEQLQLHCQELHNALALNPVSGIFNLGGQPEITRNHVCTIGRLATAKPEFYACPINPGSGAQTGPGHCHYADVSCLTFSVPVPCSELHHKDDRDTSTVTNEPWCVPKHPTLATTGHSLQEVRITMDTFQHVLHRIKVELLLLTQHQPGHKFCDNSMHVEITC